jgi:hypothetical protein
MKRNVGFARERPPGALTIGDFTTLGRSAISEDNPTDGHHVEAKERDSIHVGPPSSKVCFDSGSTPLSQMQKLSFSYTGGPAFSRVGAVGIPQRLKSNSLQSIYVRAEARTLRKPEFLRSLLSREAFLDS